MGEHSIRGSEVVQAVASVQSVKLEPASEIMSFSFEPPLSRNLKMIHNSQPNGNYFETPCINTQSAKGYS